MPRSSPAPPRTTCSPTPSPARRSAWSSAAIPTASSSASCAGGTTFANAGSVGLPYEGRAGAFWLTVADGALRRRETGYDLRPAIAELRAAGFAAFDDQLERSLLAPADPDRVTAFLERSAGRG